MAEVVSTSWVQEIIGVAQDKAIGEFLDGLDVEQFCPFARYVEGLAAQYRDRPLFAFVQLVGEVLGVVVDGPEVLLFTSAGLTDWIVEKCVGLTTEEVVRRMAPALRVDVVGEE